MKKLSFYFLMITGIFFFNSNSAKAQVDAQDSLALVALYDSTDGANWAVHTNWLTSTPVQNWFGINVYNGRVTGLSLPSNNLNGVLPDEFDDLSQLQNLVLQNNHLQGHLPEEIDNFKSLIYLDLSHNDLSDTISWRVQFLRKAIHIDLSENQLTGKIPSDFGILRGLFYLNLSHNKLSGKIPHTLRYLKQLTHLLLNNNQLSGSIPRPFWKLASLRVFNLSHNKLNDKIPYDLLRYLGNLDTLDLSYNRLTGGIPWSIATLHNSTSLSLNNNFLSGQIPAPLADLSATLHIQSNQFNFAGLLHLVRNHSSELIYSPQANIPVRVNGNILSVYTGGSYQLTLDTFKWYKNGTLAATIIGDSTYIPVESGNYSVAVTNSVATQLTLYSDTINYTVSDNLIASKMNDNSSISLYPNPAKTNTTISFYATGKYTITVTDISGKILQTRTGIANKGINNIQLDVSKYSSGVYLITITNEKNKKQTLRLNKE